MNINYAIPDELHRRLKIRAAEEGITLKSLILRYLEEGLNEVKAPHPCEGEGPAAGD